ncbi:PRAME family member 12-like [Urocitellus parryii]
MSIRTILTLQDVVIQNILRNEALPIHNLKYLPRVLTLRLYKEAIMGGHMEMQKKMVLSCPLACLPVDYLLKTRDVKALKTLLNGLDLLISQKIYPRKWKLKAIDFWEVNQDCPNEWSRAPLEMRNLRILHLSNLSPQVFTGRSINRWYSHRFSLQLWKVNKLRELYMNNIFFLYRALHKILLSRTPLKTLSLRGCPLKEKDLKHLSMCPSTDQLKCLDLCSFSMKDMSPEPLWVLLENVAHTLETLVLEFCAITESQLNVISPALGHCSQLKTFSFCGNQIPLTALKNLLSYSASLLLEQAKYPAPLESFDEILWGFWTEINQMKFD